jgi:hypothetical protein
MYGLPQAGIIAKELLEERLLKAGYQQSKITPGYLKHDWRPISFTLIVDNFGVKYIGKEHVHHLIQTLKEHYEIKEDWEGTRYLGITLDWDYKKCKVHLSLPGYVERALAQFGHDIPKQSTSQAYCSHLWSHGAISQSRGCDTTTFERGEKIHSAGIRHICILRPSGGFDNAHRPKFNRVKPFQTHQ